MEIHLKEKEISFWHLRNLRLIFTCQPMHTHITPKDRLDV
jgi:hypothetical protein